MKKSYDAPSIIPCGTIVSETKSLNMGQEPIDTAGVPFAPGSVGFYL